MWPPLAGCPVGQARLFAPSQSPQSPSTRPTTSDLFAPLSPRSTSLGLPQTGAPSAGRSGRPSEHTQAPANRQSHLQAPLVSALCAANSAGLANQRRHFKRSQIGEESSGGGGVLRARPTIAGRLHLERRRPDGWLAGSVAPTERRRPPKRTRPAGACGLPAWGRGERLACSRLSRESPMRAAPSEPADSCSWRAFTSASPASRPARRSPFWGAEESSGVAVRPSEAVPESSRVECAPTRLLGCRAKDGLPVGQPAKSAAESTRTRSTWPRRSADTPHRVARRFRQPARLRSQGLKQTGATGGATLALRHRGSSRRRPHDREGGRARAGNLR